MTNGWFSLYLLSAWHLRARKLNVCNLTYFFEGWKIWCCWIVGTFLCSNVWFTVYFSYVQAASDNTRWILLFFLLFDLDLIEMKTRTAEISEPCYRLVLYESNLSSERCAFSLNDVCIVVWYECWKKVIRKLIRQNIIRHIFRTSKFLYGKSSFDESFLHQTNSLRENFITKKLPYCKISYSKILHGRNSNGGTSGHENNIP